MEGTYLEGTWWLSILEWGWVGLESYSEHMGLGVTWKLTSTTYGVSETLKEHILVDHILVPFCSILMMTLYHQNL